MVKKSRWYNGLFVNWENPILKGHVTVATSLSQADVIYNQLGEYIDVVVEPERRDTFPAIALAASYLKYEKSCADEEVVVVMPCDPFYGSRIFQSY